MEREEEGRSMRGKCYCVRLSLNDLRVELKLERGRDGEEIEQGLQCCNNTKS